MAPRTLEQRHVGNAYARSRISIIQHVSEVKLHTVLMWRSKLELNNARSYTKV
jgi:hypothetical protein